MVALASVESLHRHPVEWFNSYYNYRARQKTSFREVNPFDLVGVCREGRPGHICTNKDNKNARDKRECLRKNVCTDRSKFHHALSRLGKTPMRSARERELLKGTKLPVEGNALKGKIFLMELKQLSEMGGSKDALLRDMGNFLGLETPLSNEFRNDSGYSEISSISAKTDMIRFERSSC